MHRIAEINEHLNAEIKRNNTRLNEHDKVLVVHDEEIEKRATVLQMNLKTDLTEHEQLENTTREGLKRRAAVRTVRVVQKDLHDLIQKCAYLEKVSGLSQRFIEWFHNRGSVYEQNCQTIASKGVSKSGSVSRGALGWPRGAQGTILDHFGMILGRILV